MFAYRMPIAILLLASGITCFLGLFLNKLITCFDILTFPTLILIGVVVFRW